MTRGKRGFGMRGARVSRAHVIVTRDDARDDALRRVIDARARRRRRRRRRARAWGRTGGGRRVGSAEITHSFWAPKWVIN